jgi:poly(3-hydroxybutyrate) depolymerase
MHYEAKGAGHYGIFSGRRWRELVYPQVRAFIHQHHTVPDLAPQQAHQSKTSTQVAATTKRAGNATPASAPPTRARARSRSTK